MRCPCRGKLNGGDQKRRVVDGAGARRSAVVSGVPGAQGGGDGRKMVKGIDEYAI